MLVSAEGYVRCFDEYRKTLPGGTCAAGGMLTGSLLVPAECTRPVWLNFYCAAL